MRKVLQMMNQRYKEKIMIGYKYVTQKGNKYSSLMNHGLYGGIDTTKKIHDYEIGKKYNNSICVKKNSSGYFNPKNKKDTHRKGYHFFIKPNFKIKKQYENCMFSNIKTTGQKKKSITHILKCKINNSDIVARGESYHDTIEHIVANKFEVLDAIQIVEHLTKVIVFS